MQMACNYNLIGKQIDVMTAPNEPAYEKRRTFIYSRLNFVRSPDVRNFNSQYN